MITEQQIKKLMQIVFIPFVTLLIHGAIISFQMDIFMGMIMISQILLLSFIYQMKGWFDGLCE